MHKSVVPTKDSEGCPPEVVFQSLHRNKSEEDANTGRAEEIRLCVTLRRKRTRVATAQHDK